MILNHDELIEKLKAHVDADEVQRAMEEDGSLGLEDLATKHLGMCDFDEDTQQFYLKPDPGSPIIKDFIWFCEASDVAMPFKAKDDEEAFRVVLACRLRDCKIDPTKATAEEVANQVGWMNKHDKIIEINGKPFVIEPFAGDIPEVVE